MKAEELLRHSSAYGRTVTCNERPKMKDSTSKYHELFSKKRESNEHDYKKEIDLSTKPKKYEFLKDLLAFANYGGGFLLYGIDETDFNTLVEQKNEYDAADISNIIDDHLGYNIGFDISYFFHDKTKVAILEILPSTKMLTSPRTFSNEKNKVIIDKDSILTRRGTKSTKANTEDIESINKRIQETPTKQNPPIEKEPVFRDTIQEIDNLYNAKSNKYIFDAEQFAINIRGCIWYSKLSKPQFSKHTGINLNRLNELTNGKDLPTIEELYRISKEMGMKMDFFFRPNMRGSNLVWQTEPIRYTLIKLFSHKPDLRKINDLEKFLGEVVYQTATHIQYFISLMDDLDVVIYETNILDSIQKFKNTSTESERKRFLGELRHQYYKVIEIGKIDERKGYTKNERLFSNLTFSGNPRIFVESIKSISLSNNNEPKIEFHFWSDLYNLEIRGRQYNDKEFEMEFGDIRIKIE